MSEPNRIGLCYLPDVKNGVAMTRMTAVERLSEPFTIVVDIEWPELAPLTLHAMLGHAVRIVFAAPETYVTDGVDATSRIFHGILWEYVELGMTTDENGHNYRLTLRPNLELRTLERESLIYYNKTITDLVGVFPNFNITTMLNDTYAAVEYRVQYEESGFAFLARQLEKEGIYYFYRHSDSGHECVLVDMLNQHAAATPATAVLAPGSGGQGNRPTLTSLVERRSFSATKYVVEDYDYTAPTVSLEKDKSLQDFGAPPERYLKPDVVSAPNNIPRHIYPAGFNQGSLSDAAPRYAERWLDRDRRSMARSFAEGNVFSAAVGRTLTIDFSEIVSRADTADYLIVGTTHRYTGNNSSRSGGGADEDFHVELELMPATQQYRPARSTPIPRIYGPQTAVVIGPSGEEIYTDKYGRVKVKFFWDTVAPSDDTTSVWCRVGQSGAGPGFGTFMVPRIGQEVIVEFLNGDPDTPIITGAVYNGTNLPDTSFGTAADNTIQGIRTNSSKGGGGYNEIKIDDKKGSELFSLHAQKDLKWVVDKGDETRDLNEGSRTTTIHKGDETLVVTEGKRTTTIKGDEATTIQSGDLTHEVTQGDVTRTIKAGKRTTTIEGDDVKTIKTGDHKTTVSTGNREATISSGNDKLTVSVGNVTIAVNVGSHKTTAGSAVEITCGGSSIKMDPMSISLKAPNVTIEGSLMLQTKGLMIQQEASAMHIVKGGIVMIN